MPVKRLISSKNWQKRLKTMHAASDGLASDLEETLMLSSLFKITMKVKNNWIISVINFPATSTLI